MLRLSDKQRADLQKLLQVWDAAKKRAEAYLSNEDDAGREWSSANASVAALDRAGLALNNWIDRILVGREGLVDYDGSFAPLGVPLLSFAGSADLPDWSGAEDWMAPEAVDVLTSGVDPLSDIRRIAKTGLPPISAEQRKELGRIAAQARRLAEQLI